MQSDAQNSCSGTNTLSLREHLSLNLSISQILAWLFDLCKMECVKI